MAREDGTVVFSYARYADDMVFGLPRGDKSTRVTRGLKKVLARVLRELQLGFTSTEISRKQPGRLQIIGLPLSLKSEGQLHVGIPSKRREKRMRGNECGMKDGKRWLRTWDRDYFFASWWDQVLRGVDAKSLIKSFLLYVVLEFNDGVLPWEIKEEYVSY